MFDDDWNAISVARHKKDEVDKLMRLAAPSERLVFGALALFVIVAIAVASLGTVDRSLSLDGELSRTQTGSGWQVILLAPPEITRQFETGRAVRIEVTGPSGTVLVLPGEVVASRSAPYSEEFADGKSSPADDMRRIAIATDVAAGLSELSLHDGDQCRIKLPLGRQSILRALALT